MARKNKRIESKVPKLTSKFVRYFPEGQTTEPYSFIARLIEQSGEFFDIQLPNGTKKTVHLTHIGRA